MSIQENVQIVQEAFEAIGRGDTQGLLALAAEDIEWIIPGEWPLAGTHRGHAGLAEFLQKASEMVDTSISEPFEFVAQGDRVLVIGCATGSIKATDRAFEDHFVFAITVRNGKMVNIREYIDTLALARASRVAVNANPTTSPITGTISIIGSGGMAAAIGGRAVKAGYTVEMMSRDAGKTQEVADRIGATTGTFGTAPAGDIVILALPYSAVIGVVKQYGEALSGKILIDITNPVADDHISFVTPTDSFGAQEIAKAAPTDAIVVKAFNTLFSHILAAGPVEGPLDVFIAGDDAQVKTRVSAFVESIGLRPMDIGALPMARTLEHVCLLSLGLMTHSVKHTNFSIGIGLPG